jgi:uncharacterized protein YbjT (DUF2867 family)
VPIAAIDPADIAAVAATVLTEPGPPERRAVTQRPRAAHTGQQVETLTKVLTRPLRYQPLSDEQARSEMAADTSPPFIDAFFRFFTDGEYVMSTRWRDSNPQPSDYEVVLGSVERSQAWFGT